MKYALKEAGVKPSKRNIQKVLDAGLVTALEDCSTRWDVIYDVIYPCFNNNK